MRKVVGVSVLGLLLGAGYGCSEDPPPRVIGMTELRSTNIEVWRSYDYPRSISISIPLPYRRGATIAEDCPRLDPDITVTANHRQMYLEQGGRLHEGYWGGPPYCDDLASGWAQIGE